LKIKEESMDYSYLLLFLGLFSIAILVLSLFENKFSASPSPQNMNKSENQISSSKSPILTRRKEKPDSRSDVFQFFTSHANFDELLANEIPVVTQVHIKIKCTDKNKSELGNFF
jgi:hypothetical protein